MSNRLSGFQAARLTASGRGAVATVVVTGNFHSPQESGDATTISSLNALFQAANGQQLSEQPVGKIAFGQWGIVNAEDLVVCRVSPTQIEIHCHGGDAAVRRILHDLSHAGCQVVDAWDLLDNDADRLDVECQQVLSLTSTWRTSRIVLNQANGVLRRAYRELESIAGGDATSFTNAIDRLLRWGPFGLHLTQPWSIVLTGRPNVGKSSLINALLGYERAIVFDEPGTTRDVVTGETAFNGWPVTLADTAGIRQTAVELESAGIARAQERLRSADLRLVVIDVSQPATADDARLLAEWPDCIVVANKMDLPNLWGQLLPANAIPVSSTTREGLDNLQSELVERLVPEVPGDNTAIPMTQRQIEILEVAHRATSADVRKDALKSLFQRP